MWDAIVGFEELSYYASKGQQSASALIIIIIGKSILQVHPNAK